MPVADFAPPSRLLAGGGPSTPDARVLRALTTPVIGQFDPAFTVVMDEVMDLARAVLLTSNARCFAISALASAGVESLLNTLPDGFGCKVVAPGDGRDLHRLAAECHAQGKALIVDATRFLGGLELRTDEWGIDAVCAGVDYGVGAPSGMTLVTYSRELEERMLARAGPPRTSYLDLLQLQAYWSRERLNHHTAPTSLVYGLREALRLLVQEGVEASWARHARVASLLREGLAGLGLVPAGGPVVWTVALPDAQTVRRRLLDEYGVSVGLGDDMLRIGLVGPDARPAAARTVLAALGGVLRA